MRWQSWLVIIVLFALATACALSCSFRVTLAMPFGRNVESAVGPDLSHEEPPR